MNEEAFSFPFHGAGDFQVLGQSGGDSSDNGTAGFACGFVRDRQVVSGCWIRHTGLGVLELGQWRVAHLWDFPATVLLDQIDLQVQFSLRLLLAGTPIPVDVVPSGQVFYDFTRAPELEELIGQRRLGLSYGGVAVCIKRSQSSVRNTIVRDAKGNVLRDKDGNALEQPMLISQPEPFVAGNMLPALHKVAYFFEQRETNQGPRTAPIQAPSGLVSTMVKGAGEKLPPLNGVATHPVLFNGTLLVGSGYHPASRLWLETGEEDVTQWDDPQEAADWLLYEWLADFPFESSKDAAATVMLAISLMMTRTDLFHIAGPPLFAITAPSAGIGKSLLMDVVSMAVTGTTAGMSALPEDKTEREKLITATVMESASAIVFDNVQTGSTIGNSYSDLHSLATSSQWTGRVLGASRTYSGPAGILVVMTGNNLLFAADSVSRSLEIRLSPAGIENLVRRDFKHPDIVGWTRKNRGKIIGALACIALAEMPSAKPVSRFPVWGRKVAQPVLAVIDAPDFYDEWDEAGQVDLKGRAPTGFADLMLAIACMQPSGTVQPAEGEWVTAQEIVDTVRPQILGQCFSGTESPSLQELTGYLRRNRDVTADDRFTLHAAKKNLGKRTGGKARWAFRVARVGNAPVVGEKGRLFYLNGEKEQSDG